jgi:septal ring factor EnvC (AmiA/AmiB activator)
MSTNEKNSNKHLLLKLILVVVLIWALSAVLIIFFLPEWSDRGTFGDLFGAVNALFSALAFAVLIYTITLQREEIKQNRDEIVLNRKELEKSSKLQQKAQDVLIKQVEQTHLSAEMNAMQTLVDYYNNQISNPKSTEETVEKARQKRRQVISKIDNLIDGLNDSEVE